MCGARGEHGSFEDKHPDFRLLHRLLAGIYPAAMHQQKLLFRGRKGDVAANREKGLSRSHQERNLRATDADLSMHLECCAQF